MIFTATRDEARHPHREISYRFDNFSLDTWGDIV